MQLRKTCNVLHENVSVNNKQVRLQLNLFNRLSIVCIRVCIQTKLKARFQVKQCGE